MSSQLIAIRFVVTMSIELPRFVIALTSPSRLLSESICDGTPIRLYRSFVTTSISAINSVMLRQSIPTSEFVTLLIASSSNVTSVPRLVMPPISAIAFVRFCRSAAMEARSSSVLIVFVM